MKEITWTPKADSLLKIIYNEFSENGDNFQQFVRVWKNYNDSNFYRYNRRRPVFPITKMVGLPGEIIIMMDLMIFYWTEKFC